MTDDEIDRAVLRAPTLEAAAAILEAAGCPTDRSATIAAMIRGDPAGYDVLLDGAAVLPGAG